MTVFLRRATLMSLVAILGTFYGLFFAVAGQYGLVTVGLSILLLMSVVIWALPAIEARPRLVWIPRIFALFLIGMSLWPDYISIAIPGLPWISVRRGIAVPLAIMVLITISMSLRLQEDIATIYRDNRKLALSLVVFLFATIVSTIFATQVGAAIGRLVNHLFTWWAVLIAAILVFGAAGGIERFVRIISICTILLCLLNLVEVHQQQIPWASVLRNLPPFISVDADMIEDLLRQSPYLRYRSKGVFTTSLSFAEYMVIGAPFLIYYLLNAKNNVARIALFAANILVAVSIYLNGSRLGLAGLATVYASYGFACFTILRRKFPRNVIVAAGYWGIPLAIAAFVALMPLVGRLRALFLGTGMQVYSTQARWEQAGMLPAALAKRPLFGYGPGNGAFGIGYYDPNGRLTIDSYILTAFADFDIIGGLAFFFILLLGIATAARLVFKQATDESDVSTPIFSALCAYALIRVVLSQDSNQPLLFILIAAVLALQARQKTTAR